jgi:hypothetical protein
LRAGSPLRGGLGLGVRDSGKGGNWGRGDPLKHFVPVLEEKHPKRVADGIPVFPTRTEARSGLLVQPVDKFEDLMEEERQQVQQEQGLRKIPAPVTEVMPTA